MFNKKEIERLEDEIRYLRKEHREDNERLLMAVGLLAEHMGMEFQRVPSKTVLVKKGDKQ